MQFQACGYGSKREPNVNFDGDENAVLDYRYFPTDALTYYFDHHPTAFRETAHQEHYGLREKQSPGQFRWDPQAVSCAAVIEHTARRDFDIDLSRYQELLDWANLVDGAQFATVAEATDRTTREMRLLGVVEHFSDSSFIQKAVPILLSEGVEGLASAKFVRDKYRKLAPKFRQYNKRVQTRGTRRGPVVLIDLTEELVSVVAKFAHYREYPEALYSVIVAKRPGGIRLSIGHNPWHGGRCLHDIGSICAEFGGGGHHMVGGIALSRGEEERGRQLASAIAERLAADPT